MNPSRMRSTRWLPVVAASSALIVGATGQSTSAQKAPAADPDAPPGFEQLIPRGRIAAVDDPQFVAAQDAEIADEAWILGVQMDGKARAYSLNLLNRHEVVNDRIGDRAFAAVW